MFLSLLFSFLKMGVWHQLRLDFRTRQLGLSWSTRGRGPGVGLGRGRSCPRASGVLTGASASPLGRAPGVP